MKKLLLPLLSSLIVLNACKKKDDNNTNNNNNTPQTEIINLKVDGYSAGSSAAFQAGFVSGESAEVTLGPVAKTFQVTSVQFLFGGNGSTPVSRDIVLKIYKDIGIGTPGTELHSATYSIAASDDKMQEIDLTDQNIVMTGGGSIRVAIQMTAAGLPSVARDADGTINTTANWVQSGGSWASSASMGISGDWIIRATVKANK